MYYVMYSTTQNNGYAVPQLYPKMSADKHWRHDNMVALQVQMDLNPSLH